MSRLTIDLAVQTATPAGAVNVVPGATAQVFVRNSDGTAGALAPVYRNAPAADNTQLTQPLAVTSQGAIPGWLNPGDYLVQVSGSGFGTQSLAYTVPVSSRDVVSASPGPAPGNLGWDAIPSSADYVAVAVGAGVGLVNAHTGNTDYSTSSGDHAAVIQQAMNNLLAGGGPTAGLGGAVVFKQPLNFTTQLQVHPNIALIGSGAHGYLNLGTAYGPVIQSSFNGDCILVTGDARGSTFPYLARFELAGGRAGASQCGICFDTSGGSVRDVFLEDVFVDNMGQHGMRFGGTTRGGNGIKIHARRIYIEICAGNGFDGSASPGGDTLAVEESYIEGNVGWGLLPPASAGDWSITGGRFTANTAGAVLVPTSVTLGNLNGTTFDGPNGSAAQVVVTSANFASARPLITGCKFHGANAVTNHIVLAGSNSVTGLISACTFYGSTGDPVVWTSRAANAFTVANCLGYNDTKGKITNPFSVAGRIGAAGTASVPAASTAYKAEGTAVRVASTGGTGVSITITDPGSNTIESGLSTYSGILPVGHSINFGAFSVAPTVYAGVV